MAVPEHPRLTQSAARRRPAAARARRGRSVVAVQRAHASRGTDGRLGPLRRVGGDDDAMESDLGCERPQPAHGHRHPHPTAERHGATAATLRPRGEAQEAPRAEPAGPGKSRRKKMKVEELQRNVAALTRKTSNSGRADRLRKNCDGTARDSGEVDIGQAERGAALGG